MPQAQGMLTPIFGIRPETISAMVNRDIVEEHIDEASFEWLQYRSAVERPDYLLEDLQELSGYIDANLEGIYLAGDIAWQLCEPLIQENDECLFPAAVLALRYNNIEWFDALLNQVNDDNVDALIDALGWLDYSLVEPFIQRLLASKRPFNCYIALAACGLHRQMPAVDLTSLIALDIPLLTCRIFRLIGELKRHEFRRTLHPYLVNEREDYRFWSGWALALLGERITVLPVLNELIISDSEFTQPALQIVLRITERDEQIELINHLIAQDRLAFAVMATGIAGYADDVDWLIEQTEKPELARLAGEAISMITGVDLDYDDLVLDDDESDEDDLDEVESDEDEEEPFSDINEEDDFDADLTDEFTLDDEEEYDNEDQSDALEEYQDDLPIPDPKLVSDWWQQYKTHYQPGIRYLAGKPIDEGNLYEILYKGFQRQRNAAALELALLSPENSLLETRSRAKAQLTLDILPGGKHG